MSYRDRASNHVWPQIGCFLLGSFLLLANLLIFASWCLSFWDPSTDTYRSVTFWDFLVVPGVVSGSFLLMRFYFRKLM